MDMGVGFSEILLILVLILIFFGPKELPRFIREGARLIGKLRGYTDRVKRELNDITTSITPAPVSSENVTDEKKKELRRKYSAARKALTPEERAEKSKAIIDFLKNNSAFKKANAVLVYVEMGSEVATRPLVEEMLNSGKRVVVPYLKVDQRTLGICAIADISSDIIIGAMKTPEPRLEIRDNFYRSDLQLIVCPGVAFDKFGGRLGRGKAYYDNFLRELKGKVPIFGIGFECQFMDDQLPFSYSDIAMDQIITERGTKLPYGDDAGEETVALDEGPTSPVSN
jgi:5-formyltetrahydrofolate cyclo-ligase